MEDLWGRLKETAPANVSVSNPVWLSYFRVHHRILNSFREGRIFFAGDAAHIHSPVGGQGMNTGIQDAHNLAWKLALVLNKAAKPELLDTYNSERHAVGKNLVKGTDTIFSAILLRNPVSRAIRDRVAAFLSSLEVVQQRLQQRIAMLSIDYRESPLSIENRAGILQSQRPGDAISGMLRWHEFGAGPNAGDRAIDASSSDRRLFTVLNGLESHLLLFAGANPTDNTFSSLSKIVTAVGDRFGSEIVPHIVVHSSEKPDLLQSLDCSVLLDPEGDCHHRYGARSHCLYLIRPDLYVGFRSQPADLDSLFDYCNKFFLTPIPAR